MSFSSTGNGWASFEMPWGATPRAPRGEGACRLVAHLQPAPLTVGRAGQGLSKQRPRGVNRGGEGGGWRQGTPRLARRIAPTAPPPIRQPGHGPAHHQRGRVGAAGAARAPRGALGRPCLRPPRVPLVFSLPLQG